jgi:hypothetical protein
MRGYPQIVEASMHAPLDRSGNRSDKSDQSTHAKSGRGFVIFAVLLAIGLLLTVTVQPKSTTWVSQAVQAEFGGGGVALDMPKEPDMQIRSVQAY